VLLQTYHPQHPLLRALVAGGYPAFAARALEEREAAALPPFGHLALLRAEGREREAAAGLLQAAMDAGPEPPPGLMRLGPVAAPRERVGGRYRQQVLVQAAERRALHAYLSAWLPRIEALPAARRLRWSLDVDPQDLA
jgi:primosomal protein N' (replication factor Y)